MAYESPVHLISFPTTSTGIARYRFVDLSTSGNLIYTVSNGNAVGVVQDGSTGSTVPPNAMAVMTAGISKVAVSTASTVGVGQTVAATSRGSIKGAAAASHAVGKVVAGTSGGAGRIVSVLISPVGHSTALA